MSTTTQEKKAPNPRLTITLAGEEKKLFMSFGLLNEICRGLGDAQGAVQVSANSQLRDYVLMVALSPRNEEGDITKPINVNRLDMSVEDGEALLSWVSEHAMDFFLRTMERIVTQQKTNDDRLKALAALKVQNQES